MKIVLLGTPEVEDKGKYSQLLVKYNSDGRDGERKIMSFTFKDVYETLKKAQTGDAFDIKLEKDGKYWNWVGASPLGNEEVPVSSGTPSKKASGGWETPEERAAKQVYIVRQSSLSNAIEMFKAQGKQNIDEGDVIMAAKEFEAYVFGNEEIDLKEVV